MSNSKHIKSSFDYLAEHAKREEGKPPYIIGTFDSFFKGLITAGWCVKSNGDVESASGYYALFEISETDATDPEFQSFLESMLWFGNLPPVGWYVSIEDDLGFIYVYPFTSQYAAETAYEELEQRYENWLQLGEED